MTSIQIGKLSGGLYGVGEMLKSGMCCAIKSFYSVHEEGDDWLL